MSVSLKTVLATLALTTSLMAQNADVDPNLAPSPFNPTVGTQALGDLVAGPFDVELATNDNRCLGVEYAWGHFWVSGRGNTNVGDDYKIHKFDFVTGSYVASFDQVYPVTGSWGGRDMESVEASNILWLGGDGGEVGEYDFDPATGSLTYRTSNFINTTDTIRALCQNPNTGNFYTKSFTGDIREFDMSTGMILNQWSLSSVSAYGAAWDYGTGMMWLNGSGSKVSEIDPATMLPTGRDFTPVLGGSPGGMDVYDDPLNTNGPTLVQLHQTAPDQIACYDTTGAAGAVPIPVPNLPTTFVCAEVNEGFETYGGTVPPHIAVNHCDENWVSSIDAWCNIGQQGACTGGTSGVGTFAGNYCLEMGENPSSPTGIYVKNATVMGLDGTGLGALSLSFQVYDHGEESHPIDGVWVSADGAGWYAVYSDWNPLSAMWQVVTCDLSNTPVNTDGQFYLAFMQNDNFPLGYLDGVSIDDIVITGNGGCGGGGGPVYAINNLVAGGQASLECTNNNPGDTVAFCYSFSGAGPLNTPYGVLDMSMPIDYLGPIPANSAGEVIVPVAVPGSVAGKTVHTQCIVFTGGGNNDLSNSLHLVIQ